MNTGTRLLPLAAAAAVVISGCAGVPKKEYEGGRFQQIFFGGKLTRQADFPTPEMCAAGMRGASLKQDVLMRCAVESKHKDLPYVGRVVNAAWGLDIPVHFNAREGCTEETKEHANGNVQFTCP